MPSLRIVAVMTASVAVLAMVLGFAIGRHSMQGLLDRAIPGRRERRMWREHLAQMERRLPRQLPPPSARSNRGGWQR